MTLDEIKLVKIASEELGCRYEENVYLREYTTFGIGGKCPLMIEINGTRTLGKMLLLLKEMQLPHYVIGRGSNLLADDNDIDMIFLHIGKDIAEISLDGDTIVCGAGASLSGVCGLARDNALTGLEFAYGIPGSIGGAVYMNAGAYGGEIKDVIVYAEAVDSDGNVHVFGSEEMKLSYRHSIFAENGFIITKAAFKLKNGSKDEITARMDELTAKRREKQPLEFRSAGSAFKRPEGAFAAALIEQCGLKGYRLGGAQVSEKHSGFVINRGNASFADVMAVMEHVRKTVEEKTGYRLEPEPEIIMTRK